jgi:antirestriction protein ArdC
MANMNFLYDLVTKRILDLIENGTPPWKKTWKLSDAPMNLTTKIPYKGINVWTLMASPNAKSPYWLTWKQTMALKGTVKKEEAKNYEYVVFFKMMKYEKQLSENDVESRTFPMLRYTRVYNLSQVELPEEAMKKLVPEVEKREFNPIEECENVIKNYKDCPPITHGGDRAYYVPLFDNIQMPNKEDFDTDEDYYKVLFHEAAHSTGAQKRLNRFKATDSHIFGSETYSKEELVAEMCASFLCAETGIENDSNIENSAAYIGGWMKAIKEGDKNFVISAASRAQRAADYILNRIHKGN